MALPKTEIAALSARWPHLTRSFEVYYGDQPRDDAMDALYRKLIRKGKAFSGEAPPVSREEMASGKQPLAFDIGSHVGDRIGSFRRCGAKVVALEPQPDCANAIRTVYDGDRGITVVEAACGPKPGVLTLHINSANPTVTTASPEFVKAADGAAGWEGQVWDKAIDVPVTTLDALISAHGVPDFVKIDVEGFEADVLAGLTHAVPALSFEFTTIQRDVAYQCLDIIAKLGSYRFNIALGESQSFTFADAVDVAAMEAHIRALPHEANSGDVYAFLDV